jgi:hypothetical protein
MNKARLAELRDLYRDGLLKDTIPWWQSRFLDKECGGYLTYRDADGTLLSTDKPVWILGRIIWMWSRLYNTVEPRQDWLEVARHGVDFMLKHAFDSDGRMFFRLTRDGRLLCVEGFEIPSHKTAELENAVAGGLGVSGKALLIPSDAERNLDLAARNNPRLRVVRALGVSVVDLMDHDTVIVSEPALMRLVEVLAR